ncbi:MAG: RNA polymerase sigma-70 factor (ECF subfamily) [Myxococcota bacterium]|jgi:RNA polymerase sigma-70 factor (ECF subfamily)
MWPRRRLDQLVRAHLPDLYRFALRLERNPAHAEDLLQSAFLRAVPRIGQLREDGAFRAWMKRIVYTTWQNTLAKRRDLHLADTNVVPLAQEQPDQTADARGVGRQLAAALDALPSHQREAVWLVDGQGHTYAEAAEILGVQPGTTASRVARGRAAMRVQLETVAREQGMIR